jgi:hypothetical protein
MRGSIAMADSDSHTWPGDEPRIVNPHISNEKDAGSVVEEIADEAADRLAKAHPDARIMVSITKDDIPEGEDNSTLACRGFVHGGVAEVLQELLDHIQVIMQSQGGNMEVVALPRSEEPRPGGSPWKKPDSKA